MAKERQTKKALFLPTENKHICVWINLVDWFCSGSWHFLLSILIWCILLGKWLPSMGCNLAITTEFGYRLTQPCPRNGNVSLLLCILVGGWVGRGSGSCLETILLAVGAQKKPQKTLNWIHFFVCFSEQNVAERECRTKEETYHSDKLIDILFSLFSPMFNPAATVPGISYAIFYSVIAVSHWPNCFFFLIVFVQL